MAKKMAVKQVEQEAAEETQETKPASNVKKLVKKEAAPAPAAKKEKAPPKEVNENEVTLKEICEEHDLNATTARVKLRRKFGAQGLRYVWEKDSDELAEVIALLTTKAEKEEKEEKKAPAAKKAAPKKKAKVVEPDPEDEEGTEDEEGEEVDPE